MKNIYGNLKVLFVEIKIAAKQSQLRNKQPRMVHEKINKKTQLVNPIPLLSIRLYSRWLEKRAIAFHIQVKERKQHNINDVIFRLYMRIHLL